MEGFAEALLGVTISLWIIYSSTLAILHLTKNTSTYNTLATHQAIIDACELDLQRTQHCVLIAVPEGGDDE